MFFRSEEQALEWCQEMQVPPGATLSIPKAWELGKIWYRDRLDLDWTPKTVESMRAIFSELELTGEFWTVG